ncbi:MAG TPA: glycerophosphodiester phosphodiesterase family protein [Dysgonamonadaceae bacterium]|nr:glycerophosphodiester phosphodiesterase family protein [Dysgonamonadaceae bacterium]
MEVNSDYKWVCTFVFSLFFIPCFLFGQKMIDFQDFRKPNNGVYVIAHRGAHQLIPENSLPAYQKAIDLGCDFVEIDVRTTKDGKFVSIHNSTIDAYTIGKKGRVKEFTLAELKSIDIGEKLGEKWKNTRIPTFEEILQLCKGKIGIYLDLKDAPIHELMEIIRKYEMEKDVIWYIPYQNLIDIENVEQLFGNSFPMPDPGEEKNIKTILKKIKTPVIATDMGVLTQSFVDSSHKFGAKVFVDEKAGTVAEWKKIIGWRTDGIQTDKPAELIEFLKQY